MLKDPLILDASVVFNFGHRGAPLVVLQRLHERFTLLIPPAVVAEVIVEAAFDYRSFVATYCSTSQAQFGAVPADIADLSARLGSGELEVILLCLGVGGTAVLDDRAGRIAASRLRLNLNGTLGLMKHAVESEWLSDDEALTHLRNMQQKYRFRCPPIGDAQNFSKYVNLAEGIGT